MVGPIADPYNIAVDAFIYGYPLLLTELTRRARTNVTSPTRDGRAPVNQFGHTAIVSASPLDDTTPPDVDTLRSTLWYDVSREPIAVRVPDSGGRYYALWMRDMWTHLFAVAGTRNTGTATQIFMIVPPRWRGTPAPGAVVIQSPTLHGSIDVKVRVTGVSDLPNVQRFQRALSAVPLSKWGSPYEMRGPAMTPSWDTRVPPRDQIDRLNAGEFLALFSKLTRLHPPAAADAAILARLERIGIVPGSYVETDRAGADTRATLERAWQEARRRIAATPPSDTGLRNGWRMGTTATDFDAADYLHRAAMAYDGLSPIPVDDAISLTADADADGRELSSENRYVVHFDARQLPPVRGFWSLTMYDDRHRLAVNAVERYAIGDGDAPWLNADGSLDLYVQQHQPGPEPAANWLPAPRRGPFSMTLRLYWPARDAIEGRWGPPAVRRVS
jgi:hypothetical protein